MRDPQKRYNIRTAAQVMELAPNFDWKTFMKGIGVSAPGTAPTEQDA